MPSREFLPIDALGAVVSVVITLGAGYYLGNAYEDASPVLSVVGVGALVGAAVVLGRYLKKA
jgi:membrane protein DedA with SNARE-associated domain